MPGLHKTRARRNLARKRYGKKNKRSLANVGTTASLPLTGPLPTLRYGRKVKDDKVVVPSTKK